MLFRIFILYFICILFLIFYIIVVLCSCYIMIVHILYMGGGGALRGGLARRVIQCRTATAGKHRLLSAKMQIRHAPTSQIRLGKPLVSLILLINLFTVNKSKIY